jgi:mycoredoxin-dependent peroxiredoxin
MTRRVLSLLAAPILLATLQVTLFAQAAAQPPASQAPPPPPPSVKVGDAAPDFSLEWFAPAGEAGKFNREQIKLSSFKGKQNVVIAFFPAAFSPGCTSEMQKYQASSGQFTAANTVILGVSVDSSWANKAFREQIGASFPILSDWKKDTSRQYGLLNENTGFARRATFVVDKQGIVQKVDIDREALDPSGVVGMCEKLSKSS